MTDAGSTSPKTTYEKFREETAPLTISVPREKDVLSVTWADGYVTKISAPCLRANCKSAKSKWIMIKNLEVPPSPDLKIKAVKLVGTYAINIVFSDGFDRGIYPWSYLQELAKFQKPERMPVAENHSGRLMQ